MNWEVEKQGAYRDHVLKQLGEDGYNAMRLKAHGTCKRKDEEARAYETYLPKLCEMADDWPFLRERLDKYSRTRKLKPWHILINYPPKR